MPKICIVCATMFDQTNNAQKGCSEKCKKILLKKRKRRYEQSEKGKATNKRSYKHYLQSEKGNKTRKASSKKYGKHYYRTERGRFLINENKKKIRRKKQLAYAVIKSLGIKKKYKREKEKQDVNVLKREYQNRVSVALEVVKSLGIQL